MGWIGAYVRGLLIVAYFVIATVLIPNAVIRLQSIAGASGVVRDGVVLAIWGAGLGIGLWALRRLQARGII